MSIVISFLAGAVFGFLTSWFVWKNNKRKWEKLENKYQASVAHYESIRAKMTKNKDA
jgi:HAMP domain-containing protein